MRVVAGWPTNNDAPLFDKKIRGELEDECLRFKLPLKLQVAKPAQTVSSILAVAEDSSDDWHWS